MGDDRDAACQSDAVDCPTDFYQVTAELPLKPNRLWYRPVRISSKFIFQSLTKTPQRASIMGRRGSPITQCRLKVARIRLQLLSARTLSTIDLSSRTADDR